MSRRSRTSTASRAVRRPQESPQRVPPRPRWFARVRPWQGAAALALLHLVLALLSLNPRPHEGGDSAAYLALARSMLEHGTYQELWDPANRPHTQYPPGWPLILAGAMIAGVKPWIGFKVLVILFSTAAVGLSYLWARRVSTAGVALAVGVLLAVSPGVVDLARWELSDVPFWCFTMLALWAFAGVQKLGPGEEVAAPGEDAAWLKGLALASAATLLAYVTRSAGVPLVVAAAAWLAWRRRWRGLGLFAGVVAPFALAWWARGRMVGGTAYTAHLWYVDPYRPALGTVGVDGMLARIATNLLEYAGDHLPYLLIGRRDTGPAIAVGIAVLVLAAAGWGMRRRRAGVAELWLPLYVGLVMIWPAEWSGERFLLPALPMLLVCAAEAVRAAGARVRRPALLGAGLAALLVAGGMPRLSSQIAYASACRAEYGPLNPYPCLPEPWADYLNLAGSIRGELPENSTVLSRKPTLFWAASGYRSRTYPFTVRPDSLLLAAREANARYVMLDYLDNISPLYLAPVLMQRPQAFCVMAAVGPGRATLMGILPGAEQMPNVRGVPGTETVDVQFKGCGPELWGASAAR